MHIKIAKLLLNSKAFVFRPDNPFTWASGIKAPFYCDNRILLSLPQAREQLISAFEKVILQRFPEVEVIAGVATAGIAHAALLAERLKLPMVYVRNEAKNHGKKNAVEGILEAGSKVVVIEDLISTGQSSLRAASNLKEAGGEILGVMSIFSYNLPRAHDAFEEAGIQCVPLTILDSLVMEGLGQEILKESHLEVIKKWREEV